MDKILNWIKKNGITAALIALIVAMLVFPDVKAWIMRQVASTGLLNPKIEQTQETETEEAETVAILPEFIVSDSKGLATNTADLNGKVVFINFWASWCPPCRAEFPSIQKFYDKYKDKENIVFLTVNMDEKPELGMQYLEKEKYSIPFLVPSGNVPQEYFKGALPTTVILDKSGKIRMFHAGMADYSTSAFYSEIDQLIAE